jgi:hypothetical protein
MEMPTLAGNVLEQWGITAAPAGGNSNAQGGNLAAMFVGNWRCGIVIAGQPYTVNTTINADGTLSGTCLNVAGQVVGTGGGKWTLTNDGVYHFSGTYEEDATIRFPDKDTYIYTCRKSTNPIAIPGAVVTNRRVK